MSVDEKFLSIGRVFVEVLRPAVYLLIDNIVYGSFVSYCSVGKR